MNQPRFWVLKPLCSCPTARMFTNECFMLSDLSENGSCYLRLLSLHCRANQLQSDPIRSNQSSCRKLNNGELPLLNSSFSAVNPWHIGAIEAIGAIGFNGPTKIQIRSLDCAVSHWSILHRSFKQQL
jgi:hypothetical protein